VDLHRPVRDAADHFAGEHLAAGGLGGDIFAAILGPRRFEHHAPGGIGFGPAVRQHRLYQLEFGDRLSELLALHGIGEAVLDEPFGHADAEG